MQFKSCFFHFTALVRCFSPDKTEAEAASKTHISGLATKARRHKVLKLNWLNTALVRCFSPDKTEAVR